jgi:CelD/BcsL family acetyltransferase involved in cellulose biosynthesis
MSFLTCLLKGLPRFFAMTSQRGRDAVTVYERELSWDGLGHGQSQRNFSFGALHVERILSDRAFRALAPEWLELDALLSPRLPFTSPIWCLNWWKHFKRDSLILSDRLNAYAVRDDHGRLVAVAPMIVTHRLPIGPLRMRELQFMGADANVTELRGVVCQPGDLPRVIEALQAAMAHHQSDWDWVQWRGLRNTEQPVDWQRHVSGFDQTATLANHYLVMPARWEEFKARLPRNVKESLRKCYNSLAREGHEFTFRAVRDPSEIPASLDCFMALHARRAQLTGTVDHLDSFAQPVARAFLHDYAAEMAQSGNILVFEMIIGGQVIASRVAMLLGEELYLYFSGYDPAWGRYSVMTTLLAEAFKWAIARGIKVVNLSMGTDVSKMRWRPETTTYAEGFGVVPKWRSAIAFDVTARLRISPWGRTPPTDRNAEAA